MRFTVFFGWSSVSVCIVRESFAKRKCEWGAKKSELSETEGLEKYRKSINDKKSHGKVWCITCITKQAARCNKQLWAIIKIYTHLDSWSCKVLYWV